MTERFCGAIFAWRFASVLVWEACAEPASGSLTDRLSRLKPLFRCSALRADPEMIGQIFGFAFALIGDVAKLLRNFGAAVRYAPHVGGRFAEKGNQGANGLDRLVFGRAGHSAFLPRNGVFRQSARSMHVQS
jgi:hypothetical protein